MREGAGQASSEEGPQCSNLGSMAAEERREIPLDTPCQLCPSSGANRRASDFQGCWFESGSAGFFSEPINVLHYPRPQTARAVCGTEITVEYGVKRAETLGCNWPVAELVLRALANYKTFARKKKHRNPTPGSKFPMWSILLTLWSGWPKFCAVIISGARTSCLPFLSLHFHGSSVHTRTMHTVQHLTFYGSFTGSP